MMKKQLSERMEERNAIPMEMLDTVSGGRIAYFEWSTGIIGWWLVIDDRTGEIVDEIPGTFEGNRAEAENSARVRGTGIGYDYDFRPPGDSW